MQTYVVMLSYCGVNRMQNTEKNITPSDCPLRDALSVGWSQNLTLELIINYEWLVVRRCLIHRADNNPKIEGSYDSYPIIS